MACQLDKRKESYEAEKAKRDLGGKTKETVRRTSDTQYGSFKKNVARLAVTFDANQVVREVHAAAGIFAPYMLGASRAAGSVPDFVHALW